MKLQYFEAQPVYPVYLGNTGDGLKMAQKAGAGLWHMWHFHGGYGFKFAELPFAIRHVWAGPTNENRKMIWIAVDKFGKRFMYEYPPAPQDTGTRALEYYDADIQDYPRIPCYLIFDEEGRKLGPIGIPIVNDERYDASWSEDNLAEIEKGWIKKGNSLEDIAAQIEVNPKVLRATVERWNDPAQRPGRRSQAAAEDHDADPGPPFYAMEAWPIVKNTQGGPEHDPRQRVLDPLKNRSPASTPPARSARSSAICIWKRATSRNASWGARSPGRMRRRSRVGSNAMRLSGARVFRAPSVERHVSSFAPERKPKIVLKFVSLCYL